MLNLGIANFNFETASSSISFGGEVSAFGWLGLGVSVSLNSDIISNNVSINGNLNGDNTSSTLSAGIKPLGIAAATLGVIIEICSCSTYSVWSTNEHFTNRWANTKY